MMALFRLDPRDAAARLDSLGVDPAQTDAVRQLVSLNPLPRGLRPGQLSKQAPVKIPGED